MFKIIIVKDKTGQKEVNINEAIRKAIQETLKQATKAAKIAAAKTLEFIGKINKKLADFFVQVKK